MVGVVDVVACHAAGSASTNIYYGGRFVAAFVRVVLRIVVDIVAGGSLVLGNLIALSAAIQFFALVFGKPHTPPP